MIQKPLENPGKPIKKGFISEQIIADIRDKIDIVQVVGEYVRLTPNGKNFKGLCPMHQEKTPSFYVLPAKQIFHCFGCGKGGDVYKFLMETERYTFVETVKHLASRAGIALAQDTDPESQKRARMYGILDEVAKRYAAILHHATFGAEARDYLKKRGIKPEIAEKFRLGYAPPNGRYLTSKLSGDDEKLNLLKKFGLIKERSGPGPDSLYDVFRHRLVIPITDLNGRVIGFGGRVMNPKDEPKYLNSPESELFNKRKMLFNMRAAMNEIRKKNEVVIVEGYLDVISLVQAGVENVVASLGTAITQDQVHLLARNCENVFLCYDADEAGQKATVRAISLQKETPINARIVAFDDPKDDPDSFVQREGKEKFLARMKNAKDIYTFLIDSRTKGLPKPLTIPMKEKLLSELKHFIPEIQSPVARNEVVKSLSSLLDIPIEILEKSLDSGERPATQPNLFSLNRKSTIHLQEWLIKHLIDVPQELPRIQRELSPADFSDPKLKKIYEALCQKFEASNGNLSPAEFLSVLEDPDLVSRLSELMVTLEDRPAQPFRECYQSFLKQKFEAESEKLMQDIRKAEQINHFEDVTRFTMNLTQVKRKLELLKKNP